jgi:phospholipase/carboxylesterase
VASSGQVVLEPIVRLLPARRGPRPRTQRTFPHQQLDQWPATELIQIIGEWSLRLPHVRSKESRLAAPETLALWLPDEMARGPREAFIDGHEFSHLHPSPEGSIHLTLPHRLRAHAIALGWAEHHPGVEVGIVKETLVMVYGPRTEEEVWCVLRLVSASYQFAQGSLDESLTAK